MTQIVVLQSLLAPWALAVLGGLAAALLGFALWRGLKGWPWRALALGLVLMALANPALQHEDRTPIKLINRDRFVICSQNAILTFST